MGMGIGSNVVVPWIYGDSHELNSYRRPKDGIYKRTSMKAATSVRSVAETVSFLVSEKACSITGQEYTCR